MRDMRRVLKAGAPFHRHLLGPVLSDQGRADLAVAGIDRAELVALYLARGGFSLVEARQVHIRDRRGDPLWAVVGRAQVAAA